jgi:hypothetical protein
MSDNDIINIDRGDEVEFLLFSFPDGKIEIEVFYSGDTIWLSQKRLAELFEVDRSVIGKHLKNIFESGELNESEERTLSAHHEIDMWLLR